MNIRSILAIGLLATATSACSFHARDAESYRKATREVLETRNADIKTCYDNELKKDPKVSGTIVVKLTVENFVLHQRLMRETGAPRRGADRR